MFTNGCFDIIHPGHIDLLNKAKALGTTLIVGINSDESVKKIKGSARPFINQQARRDVLLGLRAVDKVYIFDELTPNNLIKKIKPDVLVKGGDWQINEIIGADFILQNGGQVFSLPLLENYSSSDIVEKIRSNGDQKAHETLVKDSIPEKSLRQHLNIFQTLLTQHITVIEECAKVILDTLQSGKKILLCGNGGSAADAQHIAAEFVGRFEIERRAFPAIALTTDTSALTAVANDYDFERIFSRQIEALAAERDCLIAISTSGNSPNIISAIMTARNKGCKIVGMTGEKGKKLASLSDVCLMVPSARTARIQEAHITAAHIWCEIIDAEFANPLISNK